MQRRPPIIVALLSALVLAAFATPVAAFATPVAAFATPVAAFATPVAADSLVVARDISFPQCGMPMPRPRGATFGVLGTNNGTSFSLNPCLVTELKWAKRLAAAPEFYANTGNPGPVRAKRWPLGQTSPQLCSSADPNSLGCSYDYGWNAASDSYSSATDAAQRLHHVDRADARHRAANVNWWLDVETMNSWQALDRLSTVTAQQRDVATIAGETDALHAAGVVNVGIYSTRYQWGLITGGSAVTGSRFAGAPQWLAGYQSQADAIAGCNDRGVTGGPIGMTQYLAKDGIDADVVCSGTSGA